MGERSLTERICRSGNDSIHICRLDSAADAADVRKNQVSDAWCRRSSCSLTPHDHSGPTLDDCVVSGISHQRRDFRGAVAVVHCSTMTACTALLSPVRPMTTTLLLES